MVDPRSYRLVNCRTGEVGCSVPRCASFGICIEDVNMVMEPRRSQGNLLESKNDSQLVVLLVESSRRRDVPLVEQKAMSVCRGQ